MNRAYKITTNGAPLLAVEADYIHREKVKGAGGRWNPVARRWELPYTEEAWESIRLSIPGMTASEEVMEEFKGDEDDLDKPLRVAPPMPLKPGIKPFRHQYAAYAEALYVFGLTSGELMEGDHARAQ